MFQVKKKFVMVSLLLTICGIFILGCNKVAPPEEPRNVLKSIETYKAPPGKDRETYDWRKQGNKYVPPTLTDTFIADLWQRMNMDLKLKGITKNHVSEDDAKRAINVYVEKDYANIAGYRPWTHWNFVRSLSQPERDTLAKEVAQYIEKNGVKDIEN